MDGSIGLLGAGGQAREVEAFCRAQGKDIAFTAVSGDYIDRSDPKQIDIKQPSDEQERVAVIAAVGSAALRKQLIETWPGSEYATVLTPESYIDPSSSVDVGSLVAPGAVITTNVRIGKHVIINIGVTVSHDCELGDYSTLSPGAHLAGAVTIGEGVFVGIGATVKNGARIADGVVIGAGAVVLNDIDEENAVYAGVPAKKIGQNDGWLSKI